MSRSSHRRSGDGDVAGSDSGAKQAIRGRCAVRGFPIQCITLSLVLSMASILIQGGTVLHPSQKLERRAALLIRDGNIASAASNLGKADRVLDARRRSVTPGSIALHLPPREPGDEEEEAIASGSEAAVAGGFTTICCMPNTKPALDNEGMIEFVLREAERVGLCNVFPVGAITKGRAGNELAEIGSMK